MEHCWINGRVCNIVCILHLVVNRMPYSPCSTGIGRIVCSEGPIVDFPEEAKNDFAGGGGKSGIISI